MGILVLTLALLSIDIEDFRSTANQQMKDGYAWNYVGKTKPSGVPAITINPQVGDEYILFKLQK